MLNSIDARYCLATGPEGAGLGVRDISVKDRHQQNCGGTTDIQITPKP